jgi:nuclear GTP-binding protein
MEMEQDLAVTGGRDNSRKAYFREFKKVLTEADVILEVLDARDPIGCRTTHIERMIMDSGIQKRIILVLNKIDLVPRDVADKWIKYLRREYPTIGFKSSTQKQRSNIGQSSIHVKKADNDLLGSNEAVGAESLIKLLKNYSRSSNLKTSLTVGVIGYPNVGKSSLINSLRRAKVCGVGSTPGFTKVAQEVHLDSNLKLLDCPGIVFDLPSSSKRVDYGDVLLRNCIKVELLSDPIAPVQHLLTKCKPQTMMNHYSLPPFADVTQFLIELARARGKIKRGGLPDLESAARLVLNDWNTGKIAYYTLPPTESKQEVAQNTAIVDGWSREFNLAEFDQAQILENAPTTLAKGTLVMNTSLDASNADGDFLNTMEEE